VTGYARKGVSMVEVLVVVMALALMSGSFMDMRSASSRVDFDRVVWEGVEKTANAARIFRIERGVLPDSIAQMTYLGYIGRRIPPFDVTYGMVADGAKRIVFAGSDSTLASAKTDSAGNVFRMEVQ